MREHIGVTQNTVTHKTKHGEAITYRYWKARIMVRGKHLSLGHFKNKRAAMRAYRKAREALVPQA